MPHGATHCLNPHGSEPASAWVQHWSHLVRPGGVVLDVACGHGRHARWLHAQGHPLVLVDRAQAALDAVAQTLPAQAVEAHLADIENGPWPLPGRRFDAVVVTNYLWRPLMPTLLASLAPGGLLIYETFAAGNETVGKPSRPDFLLANGELLELCRGLRIVAFEDGFEGGIEGSRGHGPAAAQSNGSAGPARFVQRIAAVRENPDPGAARYRL
ncbi:MAG: class I SAM-dependent methyltransferase [Polaromonas sp.]|nr:class I SAM-dependent methyltransferase [Polaromonas sp.]